LSGWNPYAEPTLELGTSLSAADCRDRLARRVAPWYEPWPSEQRPLKGRVGPDAFAVYRFRSYRHGFETEARGRLGTGAAGTNIRVRFGFKLQDRVFFVVWLAFTFGMATAVAVLPSHARPAERWLALWYAGGLNAILLVVFLIVRRLNRDDLGFLIRLIEDELEATPLAGGGPIE
jgi:hypothetical protein